MAEHDEFYQRALYYDIVMERDVTREVDFLVDLHRHFRGGEPQSILDIACGPGYHARDIAQRGIRAVGLDLRPEMIEFAREKDAQAGTEIEWHAADMRDFDIDAPVDVAGTMFDSLDALTKNEDLVQHFKAVARNLNPGGIYVIDLSHPRDTNHTYYRKFEYEGERDGLKVHVYWATNDPCYDIVDNTAYVELEIHIDEHGEKTVIKDSAWERLFLPVDLSLLAEMSGQFKLLGVYGNYDLDKRLDFSPESERMILAFQKIA